MSTQTKVRIVAYFQVDALELRSKFTSEWLGRSNYQSSWQEKLNEQERKVREEMGHRALLLSQVLDREIHYTAEVDVETMLTETVVTETITAKRSKTLAHSTEKVQRSGGYTLRS